MDERVLRLSPGLLVSLQPDGGARVWQPQRRTVTTLDADLLALLVRFGDGRTIAEAAEAAGLEPDDTLTAAVAGFVDGALLVAGGAAAPPSPPRVARARIADVVDPGSFVESAGGPIVTGIGAVDGRRVAVAAWETLADGGIEDLLALQERVLAEPCPLVYLFDLFSIGRADADFASPRAIGRVYANQGRLGGLVPQIGVVYGGLWRPAAFLPAQCDAVVMIEKRSFVNLGDADAVKQFTGEEVAPEELGGTRMHAEVSGLAHLVAASPAEAATLVRRYLSFMPLSAASEPPRAAPAEAPTVAPAVLDALVPDDGEKPFAIGELVDALVDRGSRLPLRADWARELSTSFARLDGHAVGVVANASQHKGGVFTVEAADKATRFVTLCDAYRVPLVFFVDVPGFAIGRVAERAGIERAAGRLFAALATATVPRVVLIVRKAHTAGLYGMCGPAFDPDAVLALPTAQISIVGERAPTIGFERQLGEAERASLRGWLRAGREAPAAMVDEVVMASAARARLIARLATAREAARARTPLRRTIPW